MLKRTSGRKVSGAQPLSGRLVFSNTGGSIAMYPDLNLEELHPLSETTVMPTEKVPARL